MPTVLITGANRGLGLEFTRQYARDHWKVLACCRAASDELSAIEQASIHELDVTDHAAIESLASTLSGTAIDVLINNAGVNGQASMSDRSASSQAFGNTDYDNWRKTLEINLLAPMKIAEAFIDHVQGSELKTIVTLSSHLGSISDNRMGGFYSYRSSKAGVNAIMKSMSLDLIDQGVLAVALHPGWVRTDLGGENAEISPVESVAGMRRVIAGLKPEQLGKVIAWNGEEVPY